MNWKQITVSMLDSVHSTAPRTVTLGAWAEATKRSNITTPKCERPALLPHGHFVGGRSADHCASRSHIIQFDIDRKHNPDIDVDLIKELAAIHKDIVWCARSAGDGVYGFAYVNGFVDDQLTTIENTLGVKLDRCNSRSIAALRFASHDPQPYEYI